MFARWEEPTLPVPGGYGVGETISEYPDVAGKLSFLNLLVVFGLGIDENLRGYDSSYCTGVTGADLKGSIGSLIGAKKSCSSDSNGDFFFLDVMGNLVSFLVHLLADDAYPSGEKAIFQTIQLFCCLIYNYNLVIYWYSNLLTVYDDIDKHVNILQCLQYNNKCNGSLTTSSDQDCMFGL